MRFRICISTFSDALCLEGSFIHVYFSQKERLLERLLHGSLNSTHYSSIIDGFSGLHDRIHLKISLKFTLNFVTNRVVEIAPYYFFFLSSYCFVFLFYCYTRCSCFVLWGLVTLLMNRISVPTQ